MERRILNICIDMLHEIGELEDISIRILKFVVDKYATSFLKEIPDNLEDIFLISFKSIDNHYLSYVDSKWREVLKDNEIPYIKESINNLL